MTYKFLVTSRCSETYSDDDPAIIVVNAANQLDAFRKAVRMLDLDAKANDRGWFDDDYVQNCIETPVGHCTENAWLFNDPNDGDIWDHLVVQI